MDRPGFKPVDRSAKLLQAIVQEDHETFNAILPDCKPDEINKFHPFPHDVTCLMAAVQRGLAGFVQLLLEAGADVNDSTRLRKDASIHLAVKKSGVNRPEILDLLLRFGVDVNLREGHLRTALHVLLAQWKANGKDGQVDESRWPYFDMLLSHPAVNVNAKDKEGCTPLELAVRNKLTPVVNKLIQAGAVVNQHVRQAMEECMPELLAQHPYEEESDGSNNNPAELTGEHLESELYKALRNGELERFQFLIDTVQGGGTNVNLSTSSSTHNPTLLQHACERQVTAAVAALVAAGVDPNQTSYFTPTPPLIIASVKGNVEILRYLVSHPQIHLDVVDNAQSRQTALHKLAQKLHDASTAEEREKHLQCLQILLASSGRQMDGSPSGAVGPINVNAQDAFGNTALHYAAFSGVEEAVMLLLRNGAYLGLKNHLDETAVKRIMPATLEAFLDSCLHVPDGEEVSSQNFSVTFDYSLLAPPRPDASVTTEATGATYVNNHDAAHESINLHTAPDNKEKILPECEALWHLCQSSKHQYLLKHPLLSSFLMLKWQNIRFFYYANVLIYSLHVIVCTAYILLLHSSYNSETAKVSLTVLWSCLIFFLTILLARELFQLGIAPLRYLFSAENYVELLMLGCTSAVVAHWDDPASVQHLSSLAVLLAWAEALLLFGRHPRFSVFVTLFTTVSTSFLRLLILYSALLIGFALSFFLVFGSAPPKDDSSGGGGFSDVPGSLLKVSAMMTGELEFGELPFDVNPVTSRFIFLAFLFLITIVLLNLLNGMAVSDTQAIQSKAETISFVSRVDLISYLESMLLGDPFHFLAHWPPFTLIRRYCPSTSPLTRLMQGNKLRSFIRAEDTVLFYKCLPNKTFTVYPHTKVNSQSSDPAQKRICSCHAKFRLDEDILQSACQRAQENRQKSQSAQSTAHILAEMDKLHTAVQLLQNQNLKLLQLLQQQNGAVEDS